MLQLTMRSLVKKLTVKQAMTEFAVTKQRASENQIN